MPLPLPLSLPVACRHDLDLLVVLNVDEHDPAGFEASRQECLHDLDAALCAPGTAKGKNRAKNGWQLRDRQPHWLHLEHPILRFELDVQVG